MIKSSTVSYRSTGMRHVDVCHACRRSPMMSYISHSCHLVSCVDHLMHHCNHCKSSIDKWTETHLYSSNSRANTTTPRSIKPNTKQEHPSKTHLTSPSPSFTKRSPVVTQQATHAHDRRWRQSPDAWLSDIDTSEATGGAMARLRSYDMSSRLAELVGVCVNVAIHGSYRYHRA